MKEKLFQSIQEMLNDPDVIDVGVSTVDEHVYPKPRYCVGLFLGWEIAWQHLSAERICSEIDNYETAKGILVPFSSYFPGEGKEDLVRRRPNHWYPIIPGVLQALADVTGKKVYATNYHFSGWNEYYDSAETYEFAPGGTGEPKRYDSR